MQKCTQVVTVLAVIFMAVSAHAQTSHMRVLVHTHKQVHESGLGVSGWVVAPSITDASDKWLMIAGPRYSAKGWNLELMGGAIVKSGKTIPLVDARLELTPKRFGVPLYTWANLQWIATGDAGTSYSYVQADYVLSKEVALVGAETENVINTDAADLSAGPHIVVPMGRVALVGAYQFHTKGDRQFWARLVLNL
ncbi:hypothetical protein HZA85_01515 [Candidatus Uhrbacteria bacterium]|nr:hypothetical protein [Candidatus Uhrbacteria bacterium]